MCQMAKIIEHYIKNNLIKNLDMEINGVFKTNSLTNPLKFMKKEDQKTYLNSIKRSSPYGYLLLII